MKYILGLDLGIASIGWGVLAVDAEENIDHIVDCGVRIFSEGSNPKDGSSRNLARRQNRLSRRTLRRRSGRMKKLRHLFLESGLIKETEIDDLFRLTKHSLSPWQLRAEGLERKLTQHEWARVLAHITKHRGFLSNRTKVKVVGKKDTALIDSINQNTSLLHNYRTVGEMVFKDPKFVQNKRNKGEGSYTHSISRIDIEKEIVKLFECQKALGNRFCTDDFRNKFYTECSRFTLDCIFSSQRPVFSKDQIQTMVGYCQFEKEEQRAPKLSFSAETFVLLQKLKNLRYLLKGKEGSLNQNQITELYSKAQTTKNLTYQHIYKILNLEETELFQFKGVVYEQEKTLADTHKKTFFSMQGFHELKCSISKTSPEYWDALKEDVKQLDFIAQTLTLYKTDDDLREAFKAKDIPDGVIEHLLSLSFTKHINLSLEALYKLNPLLAKGDSYTTAYKSVYGDRIQDYETTQLLPSFETLDDPDLFIVNPTVKRTVSQTRKVVNAIVRKHGSPWKIHLENTRELSKSHTERRRITNLIAGNEKSNNKVRERLISEFGFNNPSKSDIINFRLYLEQEGKCMYSGAPLEAAFRNGAVECDHIVPFCRGFDNSYNNKVLVLKKENQDKRNVTPYEYFKRIGRSWDKFCKEVKNKNIAKIKQSNLLTEESDFTNKRNSHLSDTAYISKAIGFYLERYLVFDNSSNQKKVFYIKGSATAIVRSLWRLNQGREKQKNRNNDRHHAMDAIIVAAMTQSIINKISGAAKTNQLNRLKHTTPYKAFADEAQIRVFESEIESFEQKMMDVRPDLKEKIIQKTIRPIFVSRMVNRSIKGSAHQETTRSLKETPEQKYLVVKTPLSKITLSNLENIWGKESDEKLYQAIKQRLEKIETLKQQLKASQETSDQSLKQQLEAVIATPLYKPNQTSPVKKVKLKTPYNGFGVAVHGNNQIKPSYADNASMVRTDVFIDDKGKWYLVPLYVNDISKKDIPNGAIIPNKDVRKEMNIEFSFMFSLFKNDLVFLTLPETEKKPAKTYFGYFQGAHSRTGAITLSPHDRGEAFLSIADKEPQYDRNGRLTNADQEGIGIKSATSFELYNVDVLGNSYKVRKLQKRQPLHKRQKLPVHQQ